MRRRRATAWMLTAVVAITTAVVVPGMASGSARGDAWRARSIKAFLAARAADSGSETPHTYAYLAEASGRLNGWQHSYTQAYLNKVYSLANPDGGWGINKSYDAFNDGSVNPADTTYAVTLAGHVGPALLEGWRQGAVPRERVQAIVNQLVAMPRVPVPTGQCVSYSTQAVDAVEGYCVHNVNAGVGYFLHMAARYGFGATGLHRLVTDISVHETHSYRPGNQWWPYLGDGDDQDVDHQSYSAQSMYPLVYWVGREAVYKLLSTEWPVSDEYAPIAYMRLVSSPGGVASYSRTNPSLPLWCEMGDRWTGRVDQFIASPPGPAPVLRLAQAANYSARAWSNCP